MVRLWRSRPRSMVSAWTWQPAGARPAPTTAGSPAQGWPGRNLSVDPHAHAPFLSNPCPCDRAGTRGAQRSASVFACPD